MRNCNLGVSEICIYMYIVLQYSAFNLPLVHERGGCNPSPPIEVPPSADKGVYLTYSLCEPKLLHRNNMCVQTCLVNSPSTLGPDVASAYPDSSLLGTEVDE